MSNATAYKTTVAAPPTRTNTIVERIATDYVERWLSNCREYLDWHRVHLLAQEASPEVLQASEQLHPWMIRTTRLMLCQMLDPGFPHPVLAQQVEGTLWQLQEAWEQTHNPMTESEAAALLGQIFPGHGT